MTATPDTDPPFFLAERQGGHVVTRGVPCWSSDPARPEAATLWGDWAWQDGVLTARVDRYGFYSLFVYEKDGVIAVSPSLLGLVAEGCDATQDALALATLHRLGFLVGDDTPLRYVRVLPPGGVLRWDGTGPAQVTGGARVLPAQQISRDSAVEGMITHFRNAVGRALAACDGAFCLPLSGGRDSRHILLEVLHQGQAPQACVTFHHNGSALNREAQAARALTERLGVAHDILGHSRPRLADTARALIMTGLCADEHAQMMPLHDYFQTRDAVSFDGIAGDILTNPDDDAERFMAMSQVGDYDRIAREMFKGHGGVISRPDWPGGAGAVYSPGMDDAVADHVARQIAQYADAPDPYQMFWMFHRTRREINFVPQAILGSVRRVFTPYLDAEFADFCLSLPYAVTRDQQLHNDAIARAYPKVADIPYQEGFPEPPMQGGGMAGKLRGLRDVGRILGALRPQQPLRAARGFVTTRPQLTRTHGGIYALHAMCMDGLDAAKARALMDLGAKLKAQRPTEPVSDRFPAA